MSRLRELNPTLRVSEPLSAPRALLAWRKHCGLPDCRNEEAARGDRVQLQQVLVNLILNAVVAMSSVEVGARELLIRTEQGEMGGILFAVHDSGPGTDPRISSEFSNLFTPRRQAESGWVSICRSIINSHGGRL